MLKAKGIVHLTRGEAGRAVRPKGTLVMPAFAVQGVAFTGPPGDQDPRPGCGGRQSSGCNRCRRRCCRVRLMPPSRSSRKPMPVLARAALVSTVTTRAVFAGDGIDNAPAVHRSAEENNRRRRTRELEAADVNEARAAGGAKGGSANLMGTWVTLVSSVKVA